MANRAGEEGDAAAMPLTADALCDELCWSRDRRHDFVIAPITWDLGPPLLSVTLLTLQPTYGSKESEESELCC